MATTVKIFLSLILLAAVNVVAYVPAHPVNSSQEAIQGGLNATDVSMLHLSWFPNGSVWSSVVSVIARSQYFAGLTRRASRISWLALEVEESARYLPRNSPFLGEI